MSHSIIVCSCALSVNPMNLPTCLSWKRLLNSINTLFCHYPEDLGYFVPSNM